MIKTCINAALSWEDQIKAAEAAREERKANEQQDATLIPDAIRAGFKMESLSAVLMTSKKWQVGRRINVGFFDGSNTLRQRVLAMFKLWEPYANLEIVMIDSVADADVRVTFTRGGSWSYVGTDCLLIPDNEPTMQLGWLEENSPEEEMRRTSVHEWGHTMGLGHEHQHPKGGIPFNKEAVYNYYARTNGWSRVDVDEQVFEMLSINQTNFSVYDPDSIMHYPIPAQLLTDPSRAVGWNTQLSAQDKAFASIAYPRATYKPGVRRKALSSIGKWYSGEAVGTINGQDKGLWTPK